jgi:uncharacterized protein involved in exopolysaccharide biosynthesis
MSRRKWIRAGGALGFAAALVAAIQWAWTPYVSSAVLVLSPAQIPARYAPVMEPDLRYRVNATSQAVLSRGGLTNLVNTLNLYPSDRARQPMEDVIERMREDIRIRVQEGDLVSISFSYSERVQTQKVTQQICTNVIDEFVRHRSSTAMQTVEFLKDRRDRVAKQWEDALRAARAQSGSPDRLQLEVAIARKNYEEVSAQLAEAETTKNMEERRQGPLLQMLDPASLPTGERPEWWGVALLALAGGLAGAGAGWLLARLFGAMLPGRRPSYSS